MAGQGATNVSVAEQQLSTKIHGKFNDILNEVLVGLIKTTCRIKENAHKGKLKSKFHCKEKVSLGKI
jgi:hypothetical protein